VEFIVERWVEFGILGLIVLSMVTGWIVPGPVYRRECDARDRLEEENARLRDRTEEHVLPLVTRATDALARAPVAYGERARDQEH
jgi:hypothetical protein